MLISATGKVTFTGKASASKACTETLQLETVKAAFGGKDLSKASETAEIDYSASGVKLDF
ncbi:hypothetical protein [Campylobacter canadensis]|uniref:hypothetical protein n=1 Tax=Campylobacter canadensis TaxID=449520 RepID=UPI001CCEAD0C|nr:hypothetical protein [Campylobacter canadensis]MBZ8004334.1 hypothetical protein [Campylobacter canadensis]